MPLTLNTTNNILTFANGFREIKLVKNSIAYEIQYNKEIIEVRGLTTDYQEEYFHLYGEVSYQGLSSVSGQTDPNAPAGTSQNFQELVLFIKAFADSVAMTGSDIVDAIDEQLGSTVWKSGGTGTPSWGSIVGELEDQADLKSAFDDKVDTSYITAANIKILYEANANTNEFSNAEKSKLGAIEAGATADQTAEEIETAYNSRVAAVSAPEITAGTATSIRRYTPANIKAMVEAHERTSAELKTAYESNADTNAFTDLEKTKLSGIETGADVTDLANVSTALKSAATAGPASVDYVLIHDQTDNSIKRALVSELPGGGGGSGDMLASTYDPQGVGADAFDVDNHTDGTTNKVFTATEKTKLAAIEAGATADQTPSEIVSAINSELGGTSWQSSGSGSTDLTWNPATKTLASSSGADAVFTDADGSNSGLMSSANFTKLAGIEAGATADQSAAEIEALLDARYGNSTWRAGSFKGIFDTKTDLETAHPTSSADDWAIIRDGIQLVVDDGLGGWDYQIVEGYDISAGAVTNLETESNWGLNNVYTGTPLTGSDLIAGKRHENAGVIYECIYNETANYWVRYGNRTIASLDFKLGNESDDAVANASTVLVSYRLPYAFFVKNVSVAAGSQGPTGAAAIIDVHAGGTTIFSSTKASIAAGSNTGDQTGITSGLLAKGTLLEFFVDQVGSTLAGKGYSVSLQGFIIQA